MSYTALTFKQLHEAGIEDNVSGTLLLKSYTTTVSQRGKLYALGVLHNGHDFPFVTWDSSIIQRLKENDWRNAVVTVSGDIKEFSNKPSLTVMTLDILEGIPIDDFLNNKYSEEIEAKFVEFLENNISSTAIDLVNNILFETGYIDRFVIEFAAMSHHDNVRRGLLAHVLKGLRILKTLVGEYEYLSGQRDLLYLSWILHDIGKIRELKDGIYQEFSYVTHRHLGSEMVGDFKAQIIGSFGTDFYYKIQSVIMGHHGVYDDKCRTVIAYVTHLVDNMEAKLTSIGQQLEIISPTSDPAGSFVKCDDMRLYV